MEADFALEVKPVPEPGEGQMLVKVLWLSLDPYMRIRMNEAEGYAPPVGLGKLMVGGTVDQVVQSNIPEYRPGDVVLGYSGWQQYAVCGARGVSRIDPSLGPISTALGVLGMPGQTAFFGLQRLGKPRPGETVVVSAAAGAVGSVVGQIAKILGCRAVGIAGGRAKCAYVRNELGFDACVDYKAGNLEKDLRAACPYGIDVYFENVGGKVLEAVIPLLNKGARVPICGFVSLYNAKQGERVKTPFEILGALQNPPEHRFFVIFEFASEYAEATAQLAQWLKQGKLKYRETIVKGIENAPAAFIGLLRGENLGKQLVQVAEPD